MIGFLVHVEDVAGVNLPNFVAIDVDKVALERVYGGN